MSQPEPNSDDPYDTEIDKAQRLLEELRQKKEEQEKEEARLAQIENRRDDFISFQKEIVQKLRQTLPVIEEEITGVKTEMAQLEQAKTHFQASLNRLQTIDALKWNESEVLGEADRQQAQLVQAVEDYEEFTQYLSKKRKGGLQSLGGMSRGKISFRDEFWRGLAFNLPLILIGVVLFLFFLS